MFCYNKVHLQLESYAIVEGLSGETIPRHLVPRDGLEADIAVPLPMFVKTKEGAIVASKAVAMLTSSAGVCVVITR